MASCADLRCATDKWMVTLEIVVGVEERTFHVHEKLLRSRSAFFEAALSKEWKEGQARKVELPDDDVDAFESYARWLYNGKLAVIQTDGQTDDDLLAALYAFGEKALDETFQNRVIDAIVAGTRDEIPAATTGGGDSGSWYPTKKTVDYIYRHTPEGSPARRLMVDTHALKGWEQWIDTDRPESNNHEFLVDPAVALFRKRVVSVEAIGEHKELDTGAACSYHKHKDGRCAGKKE
ncbi:hypothetical protein B0A55_06160 [Friedmanniomyces simplex]|uniref:BTB domain-containing protein n=1 Tax=Friedmanniomyces simplex TaxID=329884 RepID=A0A4U0X320_9PEZI|nr:hypothetical protein B0A55_06160 [Friedmanniomyces simplex]